MTMPMGIILAYSVPDGADVLIDGFSLPGAFGGVARTPAMVPEVSAGPHIVTFRLPGYIEETRTINIEQGGYATVYAVLRQAK